jgi:hypothetical protein
MTKISEWICRHPLWLIVLGHCIFFLGIWNVQIGFGEDTTPIAHALAKAPHLGLTPNLYVDLFVVILAWVAPDPMVASFVMRFVVSLFTAVALFLVLSRFSGRLKMEAILFASFIWIASRLNAPIIQYTSQNSFSFALMLMGIYFLFSPRRGWGLLGFVFFSALAISLRMEWIAPFLLIVVFLAGEAGWKWWKNAAPRRRKRGLLGTGAVMLVLMGTMIPVWPRMRPVLNHADQYLLMGLGQCYGQFLKAEHPEQTFDPMTEYQWVLDQKFGKPTSLVGAIENNPREAMRYFRLNTLRNLRNLPEELLSTRSGSKAPLIARPHSLLMYLVLLAGGFCGVVGFFRGTSRQPSEMKTNSASQESESSDGFARKVVILVLLCSAASVAIVLLVGSPRYWISIVPLLYLIIAFCADALMKTVRLPHFGLILAVAALVLFCRPNFLDLKGDNYEVRAMRAVGSRVRPRPVIGALWAEPLVVYGFRGQAQGVSAWDGIKAEDIAAGRFDILNLDRGLRASRTWDTQRAFFEGFEAEPARYGFQKLEGIEIGPRAVYYRPASAAK